MAPKVNCGKCAFWREIRGTDAREGKCQLALLSAHTCGVEHGCNLGEARKERKNTPESTPGGILLNFS